ncbi:hypothetical protein [uncultured Fibrobacter sp.]|uniref:hypothetical protein n=1 Tax=uncultured Fibrobacter sp. TaxID=261512 RepID=UPI002805436A|nr:hypothetical protein [uncultured Fibrobacter sp.]
MQKKLVFGFAAAALAGSLFIACGDGDVSSTSADDESSAFLNDPDYYKTLIESATTACNDDPKCAANIGNIVVKPSSSSASEITEPSSASVSSASMSSASVVPPLSSSSPIVNLSSASVITSSASVIVSSSSSTVPDDGTVNGTCAPNPVKIEKGAVTTWTFKRLTPPGMAGMTAQQNAIFDWTMPESVEGSLSALGKDGGNAAKATYAKSGSFSATLQVDGNTIQCDPLQVNGAPIKGCVCSPDVANPDVASGAATVTWTVSGCTTDATITGYAWTGATGSAETATASFTEKGQEITPVVTVSNDDNTQEQFTCAPAKAVNSTAPDYELTDLNKEVAVPDGACVTISTSGTLVLTNSWQENSCSVIVTVNGKENAFENVTNCGLYYKDLGSVAAGSEACVKLTNTNTITLKIN